MHGKVTAALRTRPVMALRCTHASSCYHHIASPLQVVASRLAHVDVDIPHMADNVETLQGIGKKALARLWDLSAAAAASGVPALELVDNCITTGRLHGPDGCLSCCISLGACTRIIVII